MTYHAAKIIYETATRGQKSVTSVFPDRKYALYVARYQRILIYSVEDRTLCWYIDAPERGISARSHWTLGHGQLLLADKSVTFIWQLNDFTFDLIKHLMGF